MRTRPRPISPCALLVVIVLAGGPGAEPPQAPPRQAAKLDTALSAISTACGLAYQLGAFPPPPATQMAVLEVTARSAAAKLATVFHTNPTWVYQGETVSTILNRALATLGSCKLSRARAALAEGIGKARALPCREWSDVTCSHPRRR